MAAVLMTTAKKTAPVLALEDHLTAPGAEFADSTRILGRVTGILELCLEVVAEGVDAGLTTDFAALPGALRPSLLLDPVARVAIGEAFEAICGGEFDRAAAYIPGLRLRAAAVGQNPAVPGGFALLDPTDGPAIERAVAVLTGAVPRLWASAGRHVRLVAGLSDPPFRSGSDRRAPGVVIVARPLLADPERLAEALLHEAAHQKLYDLYLDGPVLPPGYSAAESPRLRPPWHGASGPAVGWPVDNVLAAMHVYAHLAVLRARRGYESHRDTGPPHHSALSRAIHLGRALRGDLSGHLGPAGDRLVDWLWDGLCRYAGPIPEAA